MTFRQIRGLCLFAVLPSQAAWAAAGQQQGESFSFLSSFLQMIAALGLVVGLIFLAYYAMTRLVGKMPGVPAAGRQIRILEVRSLGPRKALVLVEVGGEYLLLSSSGDQLSLIKQINMLEDIEVVEETREPASFLSVLKQNLTRVR